MTDIINAQNTAGRLLHTTPGLADRVAQPPLQREIDVSKVPANDKDNLIRDLQAQLDDEINKNRQLEAQFKYRVGSFVKRETQAKKTIEALERQLQDRTDEEHYQRMQVIRNMQDSVLQGLEGIQNNTAKVLQEQEKDLMRSFRARLQDLTKELENQKAAKGNYSAELQARHQRVLQELQASQELAAVFDKKNQQFIAENQKLQDIIKTREDDRHALLKELVTAKKENTKLKVEVQQKEERVKEISVALPTSDSSQKIEAKSVLDKTKSDRSKFLASTKNKAYERELGHREAISKLQRMVDAEKLQVRMLREAQNELLQSRTELEMLLRQCLDDVKLEIAKKQMESQGPAALKQKKPAAEAQASEISLHELGQPARERVLELLLSQQRVVQLLYDKSFPDRPSTPKEQAEEGDTAPPDNYKWIEEAVKN
ncbi:unnamed protein product [Amoebophrya sp. A25]|nr:unnamed protein product [Amoebophrya sp. A25]|eukprot:GSA25T00016676001.1